MKLFFLISAFVWVSISVHGQYRSAEKIRLKDSLDKVLSGMNTPSEKYYNLDRMYREALREPHLTRPEVLVLMAEEMLKQANLLKGKLKQAESHERLAEVYFRQGNSALAVLQWEKAGRIWNLSRNRKREGNALLKTAQIELELKNYPYSEELAEKVYKIFDEIKHKDGLAQALLLRSELFLIQKNKIEARNRLRKCIALKEYLYEPQLIAEAYFLWARTYDESFPAQRDSMLFAFQAAIKVWEENTSKNDSVTLSFRGFREIAELHFRSGNYPAALTATEKAFSLAERRQFQFPDPTLMGELHLLTADIHQRMKNYMSAVSEAKAVFLPASQARNARLVKDAYRILYQSYEELNQVNEAHLYLKSFIRMNDSLMKDDNLQKVKQLKTRYQTDEQLRELEIKKLNEELLEAESKEQETTAAALIGISLVSGLLGFTVFRRYRDNKKDSFRLSDQNKLFNTKFNELNDANLLIRENLEEVTRKKEAIEQTNKRIEAGLQYAFRIQSSILPEKEAVKAIAPFHFIFYRPKDVVSGDFYFIADTGKIKYIVAADCTGHGVPGAFMSVLAFNLLSEIIQEGNFTRPNDILSLLDIRVRLALHQDETGSSKDGMDVSMCALIPSERMVWYAGAHRPLFLMQNGTLTEIKGDPYPVGGSQHMDKAFRLHEIHVRPGDRFFQFSDGITDQFGMDASGKKRKFSSVGLMNFIKEHKDLKMIELGDRFTQQMNSWQGSQKQLDDMLMFAWEVPDLPVK